MTNFEAVRSQCKVICNVCYPDTDVIDLILINNGIEPDDAYAADNAAQVTKCAILVVRGWVETSRSEGGISTAVDQEKVTENILFWCNQYGLDSSELLEGSVSSIESASHLW